MNEEKKEAGKAFWTAAGTIIGAVIAASAGIVGSLLVWQRETAAEEHRTEGAARVLADDLRRAEDRMFVPTRLYLSALQPQDGTAT